jgi:hypothetical protein
VALTVPVALRQLEPLRLLWLCGCGCCPCGCLTLLAMRLLRPYGCGSCHTAALAAVAVGALAALRLRPLPGCGSVASALWPVICQVLPIPGRSRADFSRLSLHALLGVPWGFRSAFPDRIRKVQYDVFTFCSCPCGFSSRSPPAVLSGSFSSSGCQADQSDAVANNSFSRGGGSFRFHLPLAFSPGRDAEALCIRRVCLAFQ